MLNWRNIPNMATLDPRFRPTIQKMFFSPCLGKASDPSQTILRSMLFNFLARIRGNVIAKMDMELEEIAQVSMTFISEILFIISVSTKNIDDWMTKYPPQ